MLLTQPFATTSLLIYSYAILSRVANRVLDLESFVAEKKSSLRNIYSARR